MAFIVLLLVAPGAARAASKTWDGGCGADTSWSCASNWSDNAVPGAGDAVTFNSASSNNSTVDAGFAGAIASVNIGAGYTGTISLARSLTVSTAFSQSAGAFTAVNQTLSTAAFTLSGGNFTASSGTTSVSKAMAISGSPTFTANGGTVTFDGTASAKVSCNKVNFDHVTFTHTKGTKTVGSNCSLPLGEDPTSTGGGSITLNGTLSGTGTLTTGGLLTLGSTGSLSGMSGLQSSRLTVNGNYNFGTYGTFAVIGAFALNSGASFTAPSGKASFAGAFKINSGATFSANGGTVDFSGTSGTVSCGAKTFNLVTFTNTAGAKIVSSNCSLPLGNNPTATSGGSLTVNGSLSGTGTLTTGELLTLGGTGSLSGFSGLQAARLTVNGTYNFSSYGSFTVSGAFILSSGASFTAPAGTASFGARFTLDPGSSFVANGGTVNVNGDASGTLSCSGASFAHVSFTHTDGIKTVSSNCTFPLGADPTLGAPPNAAVVLNGSLSGTGILTSQRTFKLGETSSLSGFSGLAATSGVVLAGASIDFSSYSSFSVATNYTQSGGVVSVPDGARIGEAFALNQGATFNAPPGTAVFDGRFTIGKGANFNADGGTVEFSGPASRVISCENAVFHLVTFTHTSGTKTVSSSCNLPLGSNPTVNTGGSVLLSGMLSGTGTLTTAGTLTLGSTGALSGFTGLTTDALSVGGDYDFSTYSHFAVGGEFVLNPGAEVVAPTGEAVFDGDFIADPGSTFIAGGGTVVLGGIGQSVSGDSTFNNLRKRVSAPDTLTFNAGDTQTIVGALTLEGKDAGNLLTLVSSSPGTPWLIDREGTAEVAFVSVSDSENIGSPITPSESINEGGNTGWIFPGPASGFVVEAATTTPKAGEADNLTITAKDAQGNTATTYTGSHNLSFGPVADSPSGAHATVTNSSGTATNFGTATAISFTEGVATVSSGKNGAMTLVKAGATSVTVSDGSITNGSGLAITVSPGTAASLTLAAATTTPKAGEADNLTITAKDAQGNTATTYTGSHNLSFGPVADSPSGAHATVTNSSGTATNFGSTTAISFTEGVATVSSGKNGAMTLVKAGATSVTVSDGSITNGSGLAITVSPGSAARLAWTNTKVSKGKLSSPCLFTCSGTGLTASGNFKANVSVTDSSGNTVSSLGSGHTVSVTTTTGMITGGSLTIAGSGPAESTAQFTFTPPGKGDPSTVTAATAGGTVYTSATATMER